MEHDDIIKMANECLSCKNPLCKKGCPIETSIPEFIGEVKNSNFENAYHILQENNILSEICSNICLFEECCEGHCVKGIKGTSVKVSTLEKQVNLWANKNGIKHKINLKKNNEIKVAIIGGGPAGISCAVELAKKGFNVTIFEKENKIGGLLTYGIPAFRLPRNLAINIENKLKEIGISINCNQNFGEDYTIQSLKSKGYKAIFLGIGAAIPLSYKLCDEESSDICDATTLLREYNAKGITENIDKTVIIGGGNVAFDAARAALRMNAKDVTILYRRDREKMPARKIEITHALEEGTNIQFNVRVIEASVNAGKVKKVKCIRTICENNEVRDIENSEFDIEATKIVFAIGYKPNKKLLREQGIEINEQEMIVLDENNMTSVCGVFAGGDVAETKATVCRAIKAGKKASIEIEKYINIKKNKDV